MLFNIDSADVLVIVNALTKCKIKLENQLNDIEIQVRRDPTWKDISDIYKPQLESICASLKKFKNIKKTIGMIFYLSRNPEANSAGYTLSNYPPKRNPQYDKFETTSGKILGQLEVGSWYYWHKKTEGSFCLHLDRKEIDYLLATIPKGLTPGYCINLTTMEEFCLTEAEDFNNWDK